MRYKTDLVKCSAITHKDASCKSPVRWKDAILFPGGKRLPFYCHSHLKTNLVELRFRCLKYPHRYINYDDYVPSYLEKRTRILLREEMRTCPDDSDKAGYIYALHIHDTSDRDLVHIKVGRTNQMNRRLAEHNRNCPSGRPVLLGYYPLPKGKPDLALSKIKPGPQVPYVQMLERLVHLELADIAANRHPTKGVVPGKRLGANRGPRPPCVDCGKVHEEIFTFRRLTGGQRGREWEVIVRPVFERWGDYVRKFVSRAT